MSKGDETGIVYVDGRQSARALDIQRGSVRLLRNLGFECVTEVALANGRRADILALSRTGDVWVFEIKSSVADFQSDAKWEDYNEFCDRLYFAVSPDFPFDLLPETTGVLVADRFGGEILRDAVDDRLSAARRKAVLIRFARTAASRISIVEDPIGGSLGP